MEESITPSALPAMPDRLEGTGVTLRPFRDEDVAFAIELGTDPYVPLVGSLPAHADDAQARSWIARQRGRLSEGLGYSFAVADPDTDVARGHIGLWLRGLDQGRLTAGYSIAPSARGRGLAAHALNRLCGFAWSIAAAHRIELYIEPWNVGSLRTAGQAGFAREGLLRSHQWIGGTRRDLVLFARIRTDEDSPGS